MLSRPASDVIVLSGLLGRESMPRLGGRHAFAAHLSGVAKTICGGPRKHGTHDTPAHDKVGGRATHR